MRLLIIRHAEPNYATDSLTVKGKADAQALADHAGVLGITKLFASPLGRAQETASYLASSLKLPITTLDWTQELPGIQLADGNFQFDVNGHDVRTDAYLADPRCTDTIKLLEVSPLDQYAEDVATGSDGFLAEHGYVRQGGIYQCESATEEVLAVVCHGGLGLTWLAHLLHVPIPIAWTSFFVHTSSVTTILFDERKPGVATPRCIGMGDISHLRLENLQPSRVGIRANYY